VATQYYEMELNVPANTPADAPARTQENTAYPPLFLPEGTITGVVVTVPTGANGAVFFRLKLNGDVIFPTGSNQNGWSNLTNLSARHIPFTHDVDLFNARLDLEAYNVSSSYAYPVVIGITEEVC